VDARHLQTEEGWLVEGHAIHDDLAVAVGCRNRSWSCSRSLARLTRVAVLGAVELTREECRFHGRAQQ
jgi:hypothetical protein